MEQERLYQRTYRLLVLWIVALVPFMLLLGFGLEQIGLPEHILAKPLLWLVTLWLVGLFYIIYSTQTIYWINGISYQEAKEAGEDRRRAFALLHLNTFAKAGLLYSVYTLLSLVLVLSVWADTGVFLVLMVGAAIRTIPYKL